MNSIFPKHKVDVGGANTDYCDNFLNLQLPPEHVGV